MQSCNTEKNIDESRGSEPVKQPKSCDFTRSATEGGWAASTEGFTEGPTHTKQAMTRARWGLYIVSGGLGHRSKSYH